MADYCKQCSMEIFGEDFRELASIVSLQEEAEGLAANVLCEACGPTKVNNAGECLYHQGRTSQECYADTADGHNDAALAAAASKADATGPETSTPDSSGAR